ncbi:D-alanyl-D-alanine carboxypeptidase family protein [Acinetobacter baumannii]|uniref:D-alanyl-D-alanine carboxypeptidase family protein n=1 Tax=Acinetobacter baumannii TaxID=470 RepID=UPI003F660B63
MKDDERPKKLVQAPFAKKGMLIEPEVGQKLMELITVTGLTNKIIVTDAYRTKQTQQQIWDETILERGEIFTKKYVAKPGCSEHELGLAVDLGLAHLPNDYIKPSFSKGPIVALFLSKMADYGFILRYPKGKESVTGISFEPWHFRYVGVPHSQIMAEQGLVLEEYLEILEESEGFCNEG